MNRSGSVNISQAAQATHTIPPKPVTTVMYKASPTIKNVRRIMNKMNPICSIIFP